MRFSEAYRGSFLKAADVQKKPLRLTIESVGQEKVGDDSKIVARFEGSDQALVLNKTNASILAEVWGDDMDDWCGETVLLKGDRTQFNGKMVACIRVEAVKKKSKTKLDDDSDVRV